MALITMPTLLEEANLDLPFIEQAGRVLALHVRPGTVAVVEPTTYPVTTEGLLADLLRKASGLVAGHDFHPGYRHLARKPACALSRRPTGLADGSPAN